MGSKFGACPLHSQLLPNVRRRCGCCVPFPWITPLGQMGPLCCSLMRTASAAHTRTKVPLIGISNPSLPSTPNPKLFQPASAQFSFWQGILVENLSENSNY